MLITDAKELLLPDSSSAAAMADLARETSQTAVSATALKEPSHIWQTWPQLIGTSCQFIFWAKGQAPLGAGQEKEAVSCLPRWSSAANECVHTGSEDMVQWQ